MESFGFFLHIMAVTMIHLRLVIAPKQAYRRKKILSRSGFYAWELSVSHDERCACFAGDGDSSFLFPACVCARCHSGIAHHHDRLHDIIKALSKTAREEVNCREDRHRAYTQTFSSVLTPFFQDRSLKFKNSVEDRPLSRRPSAEFLIGKVILLRLGSATCVRKEVRAARTVFSLAFCFVRWPHS